MPNDLSSGLLTSPPTWFETFLMWYGEHYVLGTIFLFILYYILALPFRTINRFLRSRNIKSQGWPPPHLDADGDWKKENDE